MSDETIQKNSVRDNPHFRRLIFVHNPRATNAVRARKRFAEIEALLPNVKTTTVSVKAGTTTTKLASQLRAATQHTLICIGGGDGTANTVINALLIDTEANARARQATLLPLWGGNANDLATMLNGFERSASSKELLTRGKIVDIRPLALTLNSHTEASKSQWLGACYISFGLSAHAGWFMEGSSHQREKRFILSFVSRFFAELKDLATVWVKAPVFYIQRFGKRHEMYEIAFLNGSRFAKIERVPIRLVEPRYYYMDANRGHLYMLLYAVRALVAQNHGYASDDTQSFTLETETKCQVDGEIIDLPAGTKVQVQLSDAAFRALSIRQQ